MNKIHYCILNEIRCRILKCIYLDERFIRLLRTMNFDDEGGGRVWNSLKFRKCSGRPESFDVCFSCKFPLETCLSSSAITFLGGLDDVVPMGAIDDLIWLLGVDTDVTLVWHIRLGTYLHFLWGTISFT